MFNKKERMTIIELSRKEMIEKGAAPVMCMLQITTPKRMEDIKVDPNIQDIIGILDKYKVGYNIVDTCPGSYNLNRDWIETDDIPCTVESCGVYPVEWDIKDVVRLEELEHDGKVMIRVWHHTADDKMEPHCC